MHIGLHNDFRKCYLTSLNTTLSLGDMCGDAHDRSHRYWIRKSPNVQCKKVMLCVIVRPVAPQRDPAYVGRSHMGNAFYCKHNHTG